MNKAISTLSPLQRRADVGNEQSTGVKTIRLRGRDFTNDDIDLVRALANENWSAGRSQISRLACESLHWYQSNGRLKDRACRDILRSLEALGLLTLPPSRCKATRSATHVKPSLPPSDPFSPANMASVVVDKITSLSIVMVRWTKEEELWNNLVATYHYLGYRIIVGRHLKYIVYEKDIPVACLGWGDAAWHIRDRDAWIGWSREERDTNIRFVVNNVRFAILPWVKVPNFASFLLSRGMKAVREDWERFYGIRPLLLETFVEKERFKGTCYRAANWIHIGSTKGYARRGYSYHNHQASKRIYAYPLHPKARELLRS